MESPVNVTHYISELLFHHDCVVVPDFGGFVCSYAAARIHPARHTFSPPSKQVVFNKHLQQNDGLLAHAIASAVPCSFEEAMTEIQAFVQQCNTGLKAGQVIDLKNIGRLSLDPERNIRFEVDPEVNYWVDAFGLSTFQSMPILGNVATSTEQETKEVGKGATIRRLEPREQLTETNEGVAAAVRRPHLARAALFFLIPVAALALLLPFNTRIQQNMAGLGWFGSGNASLYQPITWLNTAKLNADSFALTTDLRKDTSTLFSMRLVNDGPSIVVNRYSAERESTRVETIRKPKYRSLQSKNDRSVAGNYYIIAGAFSIEENAAKYRTFLKEKGYETQVLDSIDSRLIHVSLARFTTKREAEQFLQVINGSVPDAWIFKR